MDNSINILKGIAFPVFPDPNFIIIEEIVVLSALTTEKNKITILIINVE
jgi:hypothetical protein